MKMFYILIGIIMGLWTSSALKCESEDDCPGSFCCKGHCRSAGHADCKKYQMFGAKMEKAEAIADYYYDAELEQAREERAERLLQAERSLIQRSRKN